MRKKIDAQQFNRMVFAILIKYSYFLGIPPNEMENKIKQFSEQLNKQEEDEKSIQFGQDDQTK